MMKDYRRLLRLWKQGASTRSMADALGVKRDTVRDALARIGKAYGSLDSVPAEASDEEIQERIRSSRDTADCCFMPIDCDDVLGKRRNGDTYDVLWADYVKAAKEKGWRYYGRSRFCEIVSEYARSNDITVGIEKLPGFKCEVDWAGDKAYIMDVDTGELVPVHIFVMALPYSGYFYCEGFLDEKMDSWLTGHMHAFEFFSGVPVAIVPDNCKTAVIKGRGKYDDDAILNPRYKEFADHYGVFIRPARIRHPKDKSVVERSVQVIQKDILPQMRRLDIFSLDEFNRILSHKLERRLAKPYTKRYGSRTSVFEQEEKATLHPLPAAGFHSYTEREAAVGRDGYIQYSSAFYSVPPQFIKRKVTVREMEGRLYVYDDRRNLIAEHGKAVRRWQRVTDPDHRKADLALYGGYCPHEFDERARSIGPSMLAWVKAVQGRCDNVADSYRTLLGVFSNIGRHPAEVVEEAAAEALSVNAYSARAFKALVAQQAAADARRDVCMSTIDDIYMAHEEDGHGEE